MHVFKQNFDLIQRIEAFIYTQKTYNKVLVGSGLIGGFSLMKMFSGFFNLSFPYYGSCLGIQIIAMSNKVPEILMVETNYIFKGSDPDLIHAVFNKPWYKIRFLVPAFLLRNNPYALLKKGVKLLKAKVSKNDENDHPERVDHSQMDMFINAYSKLPEPEKFDQDLTVLKKHIDFIASTGCKIIFFEMPLDIALTNARLFKFQRNRISETFPADTYKWIPVDENHTYKTTDGLHLTTESSKKYAEYLLDEVTRLTALQFTI